MIPSILSYLIIASTLSPGFNVELLSSLIITSVTISPVTLLLYDILDFDVILPCSTSLLSRLSDLIDTSLPTPNFLTRVRNF